MLQGNGLRILETGNFIWLSIPHCIEERSKEDKSSHETQPHLFRMANPWLDEYLKRGQKWSEEWDTRPVSWWLASSWLTHDWMQRRKSWCNSRKRTIKPSDSGKHRMRPTRRKWVTPDEFLRPAFLICFSSLWLEILFFSPLFSSFSPPLLPPPPPPPPPSPPPCFLVGNERNFQFSQRFDSGQKRPAFLHWRRVKFEFWKQIQTQKEKQTNRCVNFSLSFSLSFFLSSSLACSLANQCHHKRVKLMKQLPNYLPDWQSCDRWDREFPHERKHSLHTVEIVPVSLADADYDLNIFICAAKWPTERSREIIKKIFSNDPRGKRK